MMLLQLKYKVLNIHVAAIALHREGSGKAGPALGVLENGAQAELAVSSVENRNDTRQGKGAAGAAGGSLALAPVLGPAGRR